MPLERTTLNKSLQSLLASSLGRSANHLPHIRLQTETIPLDLHLFSLGVIPTVSKTLAKGNIVVVDVHIDQHPQIVPVIPINMGLVREAISTDHGLTEELPGISRLSSFVGSLVSIILCLESTTLACRAERN
jgi:hypothetical protein